MFYEIYLIIKESTLNTIGGLNFMSSDMFLN